MPAARETSIPCAARRSIVRLDAPCSSRLLSGNVPRSPYSSTPPWQYASSSERPGDPIGPDHAHDAAPLERLESGPPGGQREGVLLPDDGDLAGRRGDGAVVHTDDLPPRLGGHVGGVETARQIARQPLGLGLSQAAPHVGAPRGAGG